MITLRPMHPAEFPDWRAYFIPDFAAELVKSHALTPADAAARAASETASDLPHGTDTPGHSLLCIIGPGSDVLGYLWLRPDPAAGSAFLLDFHILPAHQGRGHGKAALAALQEYLAVAGIHSLGLRVAPQNDRARHVYAAAGFHVTGISMTKSFAPQ